MGLRQAGASAKDQGSVFKSESENSLQGSRQVFVFFQQTCGDVTDVWVAGDQVVSNRTSTKIDLTDLIKRVNLRVKALEPLK